MILFLSQALAGPLDNWTTNQVSTNSFGLDCAVYGNGRYVAYGEYSDYGVIMSSEDGINWSLRLDGKTNATFSFSLALVYTGNRFFALGGFGGSAVSTNGVDWTVFSHYANGLIGGLFTSVAYGAARYVMVGGGAYTSTDAITWTAHNPPGGVVDVAYGASKFVAIGDNSGHAYTSSAGTTWTDRSILGGNKISFCNGIFIVPYGLGTNLISSDGISWTTANTGITGLLGKVTFANGLFIARAGVYLATSTDGTNWVQYPQILPGTALRGYQIATDGSRLVTVGGTYASGGPNYYNGYTYYSDALVTVGITNTSPAQIVLSGLVGRSYRIEYVDALLSADSNNWQTLTALQLPITPYLFTDTAATNSSHRFYRGVLLP
ncbi:MAG: hypothetical protein U1F83_02410 [Verrucomicrobiota bacterium]